MNNKIKKGFKFEDCVSRITVTDKTSKTIIDMLNKANLNCPVILKKGK